MGEGVGVRRRNSWLSQGVVRGAVSAANCGGGGDGNEILHTNVPCVLNELRFNHTAWDYHGAPRPQAKQYLVWVKQQLARGWPVVMFIFCKMLSPFWMAVEIVRADRSS